MRIRAPGRSYRRLVEQGWTDALRSLHPDDRIYTFWKYFRDAFARDAGLRIDHLLLSPTIAERLVTAEVDREGCGAAKGQAITRPSESNLRTESGSSRPAPTRRLKRGIRA